MQMSKIVQSAALAVGLSIVSAPGAFAQACGTNGSGFDAWMTGFKSRAVAQGITPVVMASALSGARYDPRVMSLDRGQRSFKLSFEQFYARRVSPSLISRGRSLMASNAALLKNIEAKFGVSGAVLISIWGLETNYARSSGGSFSIFRSLATLAYDCRRTKFFENELLNALRIIQRGDKTVGQMRGGWAGEIGPMQFLPSSYVKYSVDFDGDGRRDLFNSVPDMLASTANYLKSFGWKAGQPWGPGSANYAAIREWNKAEVYQRTIAAMSAKMAGR
jgi:lytic murein transglycosylase